MENTHSTFNRVDVFLQSVKEICVFVRGSLEKD